MYIYTYIYVYIYIHLHTYIYNFFILIINDVSPLPVIIDAPKRVLILGSLLK